MVEPWGLGQPYIHFRLQTCTQPEADPRVFQGGARRSRGLLLCQHCLLLITMLVPVYLSHIPVGM